MDQKASVKIVIGVGIAVGAMLGLHFGVFKQRAEEFQASRTNFEQAKNQAAEVGGTRKPEEIWQFDYKTLRFEAEMVDLIDDLGIAFKPHYFPDPANLPMQKADVRTLLASLESDRDDGKGPALAFLGPQGWDLATELPPALRGQGISVEDFVRRLIDADQVLEVLPRGTPLYEERRREYLRLLNDVGMSIERRDAVSRDFGVIAGAVHTLNRINNVMKALPKDFFKDRTEQAAQEYMEKLFRMDWPAYRLPDGFNLQLFPYLRQIENLRELKDIAEKNGVAEIALVRMWEPTDVYFQPPVEVKAGAPKPTPTPRQDVNPLLNQGGGDGPGATRPKPTGIKVALSGPIDIQVRGTNIANMGLLHALATERIPMAVDALKIASVEGTEGQIQMRMVVNALIGVDGIAPTVQSHAERANRVLAERLSLGKRQTVLPLAVEDKLLDQQGNPLVPVPTPSPTPPPPNRG